MESRKPFPGILGCLLLLLFSLPADSFTLDGLPGSHLTPSATPLGHLGMAIGISGYGHSDEGMILEGRFLRDTNGTLDTNNIPDLLSGTLRVNVAMGVGRFVDLGLSLPFHLDYLGETDADALSGAAPGDPSLNLKAGFPLVGDHVLSLGLLASASLPTKSGKGFLPKHSAYMGTVDSAPPPRFFSTNGFGGGGLALLTMDLSRLELPLPIRAGVVGGVRSPGLGGNHLQLGGGVDYVPLPFLEFSLDVQTETHLDSTSKGIGRDWMVGALGFKATSDDGVFFGLSVNKTLSKRQFTKYASTRQVDGKVATFTYGAVTLPDWSIALSIGWTGAIFARDTDGDGVPDKQDPCPKAKEDMDGFSDFDGCPDDDNDLDSIADSRDKCPNEQEDLDGYEDHDGCAEADNDGDGLLDGRDKCPIEAEDKDGFEDYDGCPDLDNDKDGVLDPNDKCLTEPEDVDGFEDQNGCPDLDNDQDKILDVNDKCPLEAETINNFEDLDGCPDVGRQQTLPLEQRFTLRGVQFSGNTAEFLYGAYAAMDELAEKLKSNPGAMVEIRAYVDKSGAELEQFRSSEARAIAVRNYLMTRGIAGNQLIARGMGSRDPIASNKTAAGRAQNRRVEIVRLN